MPALLRPWWIVWSLILMLSGLDPAGAADKTAKPPRAKVPAAVATAQRYVQALSAGDRVAASKLDFACAYRLATARPHPFKTFPPDTDPIYAACWDPIGRAHAAVIEQREQGLDLLWPGKGALVFFGEDLATYAPSLFVMEALGASPPAGGLLIDTLDSKPLPAASFRFRDDAPVVAVPATLVRLRVTYKDPLTSPVAYAPGAYQWANTVKRPRKALKAVTLKWIVLSGLQKQGFPADMAVLNLPAREGTDSAPPIPFVTETGGYEPASGAWWEPGDMPGLLIASVARAAQFPELKDRLAMLNRILIVDPLQPEALTLLTRDLFQVLLNAGASAHAVQVTDPTLASRLNELYWNSYALTTRTDLSLGMEMGGFAKPTPADYLYRLIPAMEKLAKVRPEDLENRLRLGIAYRWNIDQLAAIETHEALLKDVPAERQAVKARALIELAWSRIAKVAWNRTFEDPGILQAYREAEEAFKLTDRPLDKFTAAYTMAYSLVFAPKRDNRLMLERLTDARKWYMELAGASPASWQYLLSQEPLKAVLDTDPSFKPLFAEG